MKGWRCMDALKALLDGYYVTFRAQAVALLRFPFEVENHLHWFFIATSLAMAAFSFWHYNTRWKAFSLRHFLDYVLPKKTYLHPSALVDYQIFLANRLISPATRIAEAAVGTLIGVKVQSTLAGFLGEPAAQAQWSPWSILGVTIAFAMAGDLGTYLIHAWHHRLSWLWEFHKVHHTAQVLTPFTLFRKHPVFDFLGVIVTTPLTAAFQATVLYAFAGKMQTVTLFGANLAFTVFRFFGANLRHSHVWISFGPVLSHVFMSPAQHQIHHSVEERHINKNYGEIFAVWDWMFGSLYIPKEKEEFEIGVARGAPQEHTSIWLAYWLPFKNSARNVWDTLRGRQTFLLPNPVVPEPDKPPAAGKRRTGKTTRR